jgi:hypothetical protein
LINQNDRTVVDLAAGGQVLPVQTTEPSALAEKLREIETPPKQSLARSD